MGQVFKNEPSKICGRQPLKNLKGYGLPKADRTLSNFSKAVFHKFYLAHSLILCCKYRPTTLLQMNYFTGVFQDF